MKRGSSIWLVLAVALAPLSAGAEQPMADATESPSHILSEAESALSAGDADKAEALYEQALAAAVQETVYDDSEAMAPPLLGLADVATAREDHQKAEEILGRALRIREAEIGNASFKTAMIHRALAASHAAQGDYPAALRAFERNLEVFRTLLGEESLPLAQEYFDYAKLLRDAGKEDAGDEMEMRGHQIYAAADPRAPEDTPVERPDRREEELNFNADERRIHAGPVTAVFRLIERAALVPPEQRVDQLMFVFEGEGETEEIAFQPESSLTFDAWQFDIFSPHARYVALPQGTFAYYHLVAVENLKAYLRLEASPDFMIAPKGRVRPEHRWLADDRFVYWTGTGDSPKRHLFEIE